MAASEAVVVRSLVEFIQDGRFPDSQAAADAKISDRSNVAAISRAVDEAIAEIKSDVEALGFENAWDLDTYLTQSRELYTDIQSSETQLRELEQAAKEHENADEKIYKLRDTLDTLTTAHDSTVTKIDALNKIWFIKATLIELRSCFSSGMLVQTVPLLKSAESKITGFEDWEHVTLLSSLKEEVNALDSKVFYSLDLLWTKAVEFQVDYSRVAVYKSVDLGEFTDVSLEDIAEALKRYDHAGKLKALTTQLKTKILAQILDASTALTVTVDKSSDKKSSLVIEKEEGKEGGSSVDVVLENLSTFIEFINDMFPEPIAHALAVELSTVITTTLIDVILQDAIPLALDTELARFERTLAQIRKFDSFLRDRKWTRALELEEWVRRVPSVWYKKKCDAVLAETRAIVRGAAESDRKIVERVGAEFSSFDAVQEASERRGELGGRRSLEVISAVEQSSGDEYDWNEEWEEDTPGTPAAGNTPADEADDGWGDFDVDLDDEQPEKKEEEDEPDDWNWGVDEDVLASGPPSPVKPTRTKPKPLIQSSKAAKKSIKPLIIPKSAPAPSSSSRSSSIGGGGLNETFVVTSVPEKLLALISSLERDSVDLTTRYRTSSIAAAGKQLRALISYVLAAYRALAPLHYGDSFDANFYLSNDCLYLAESVSQRMRDLGADAFLLKEMSNRYASVED
ncbi:Centromere/kinetochore Zw10-domain-containing protein [Myxozyma melibiosi]|uniref:Centromere/kinetochore Zw10-domain-containing protein n=1 Tax=Myxozyma melibiosi TaxID=54550 RepID=A0ABR1F765_9ASCO